MFVEFNFSLAPRLFLPCNLCLPGLRRVVMVRVMTEGTELIVSRKNLVCNLEPH